MKRNFNWSKKKKIEPGQSHEFLVIVDAIISLKDRIGDNVFLRCDSEILTNKGLGAEAAIDTNNDLIPEDISRACGDVAPVQMSKQIVRVREKSDGTYDVIYRVRVRNNGIGARQYQIISFPGV